MKQEENEFMRHELRLPELTARGMILGAILTVIFTASNVYLGLKVGLTFSSAIPAAVISMAILKMAKDSNILENNMVQTQASAAGTLSAIIFIIPGMLMIGYWQGFEFWQTLLVSACGGCLAVHDHPAAPRDGRAQRPRLPGGRCGCGDPQGRQSREVG